MEREEDRSRRKSEDKENEVIFVPPLLSVEFEFEFEFR